MTAPTIKVKVSFRTSRRGGASGGGFTPAGPTPIARRVALAYHIEAMVENGEMRDYADAAERLGLTRARVTQICDLALLAPDIQAAVLLGYVEPRDRHLRAVGRHRRWSDQRRVFSSLFPNILKEESHDDDCNDSRDQ